MRLVDHSPKARGLEGRNSAADIGDLDSEIGGLVAGAIGVDNEVGVECERIRVGVYNGLGHVIIVYFVPR